MRHGSSCRCPDCDWRGDVPLDNDSYLTYDKAFKADMAELVKRSREYLRMFPSNSESEDDLQKAIVQAARWL